MRAIGILVVTTVLTVSPVLAHEPGECAAEWKALSRADTDHLRATVEKVRAKTKEERDEWTAEITFLEEASKAALVAWMRCVQGDEWPKCTYKGRELNLGKYTGKCRWWEKDSNAKF